MIQRALLLLFIICAAVQITSAQDVERTNNRRQIQTTRSARQKKNDTIPARYPVSQTIPEQAADLNKKPLDLRTPTNIVTDTIYSHDDSTYTFKTRMGEAGTIMGTPIMMKQSEYSRWHLSQSMMRYFREKNRKEFEAAQGKDKFDFTDMYFDLGPAEKIFGPGGVRIKTQGSAEMKIGYSMQTIDNPRYRNAAEAPTASILTKK